MQARFRNGQEGIAMVTAIVAALIVSITASVVLNLTFRQFELSAFRSTHTVGLQQAEAGLQYAFARLPVDPALEANVRAARAGGFQRYYYLSCNPGPGDILPDIADLQVADEQVTELHMGGTLTPPAVDGVGGRHVTVGIIFGGGLGLPPGEDPLPAGADYRIRAYCHFDVGGQ